MLRKIALLVALIGGVVAHAQVSNPSIILVASAPSGACAINLPDEQVIGAGTIYTCQSLTWGQVGGGSGGSGFPITLGSTSIASGSTTTAVTGLTIDGVTPTTMGYVDATSSIQTQLNGKQATLTNPVTGSLTSNIMPKATGANAIGNSSVTDNSTTVTTTDAGGYVAPVFVANGTTAGFFDWPQGSTSASVAPCNTANSICWQAPTSVTSQLRVFAGSPATGFPLYTNSSGTMTETITGVNGTLNSGVGLLGTLAVNTVLSSTVAAYAGHFTNLQVVTAVGGTCTTLPQFNVFDGTSNVGSTATANASTQTKGTGNSTAQTLTFAAGDVIGIYISTAGGTCVANDFIVSAQYSTP